MWALLSPSSLFSLSFDHQAMSKEVSNSSESQGHNHSNRHIRTMTGREDRVDWLAVMGEESLRYRAQPEEGR